MIKNVKIKKSISIVASLLILSTSNNLLANVVGTPTLSDTTLDSNINCVEGPSVEFFPIGDSKGNAILSKKEFSRDCTVKITEQGKCTKWEDSDQDLSLNPSVYDSYQTDDFSDSIGSLISSLGAYDQIEHIWSGWRGYCERGTKSDFSWAEDPMFWISMIMSFILASTGPGDVPAAEEAGKQAAQETAKQGGDLAAQEAAKNAAYKASIESTKGLLADTAVGTTVNAAEESVGEATQSFLESNFEYFDDQATQSFINAMDTDLSEAAGDFVLDQATRNLGACLISLGFDMAATLYEFSQDDGSGIDCDPVDEICSGVEYTENLDTQIQTMDEVQFLDLVDQFQEVDNKNLYDYVEIIEPTEEGVVKFKVKNLNSIYGNQVSSADMDKIQQELKELKAKITIAVSILNLGGCLGTGYSAGTIPPDSDGRASIRQGAALAANVAANFMGPWGPAIAAAIKLAVYTATSYQRVDSCNNEDDAKQLGSRHEKTYYSLKFDLCHKVGESCAETSILGGSFGQNDCVLTGYTHCCYDQIMSKILVEQFKAQLGRDWSHCTGITLEDLNYVSFRSCTQPQMADPNCIDGAHQVCEEGTSCYDPFKSCQRKYKCIDMTEFKEYLSATTGVEIDNEDFEDFWDDLTEQGEKREIIQPNYN